MQFKKTIQKVDDSVRIREFTRSGNYLHGKDFDDYEIWCEYNEKDQLTQFTDSTGLKQVYEYNENYIRAVNTKNFERTARYDLNGNLVYYQDSEGFEYWNEYDQKNRIIYSKG